jgi:hypothetical protein
MRFQRTLYVRVNGGLGIPTSAQRFEAFIVKEHRLFNHPNMGCFSAIVRLVHFCFTPVQPILGVHNVGT